MAALVDHDHRVAGCVEVLGYAVPESRVGRQTMDEHEGNGRLVADPDLDVQLDTRGDHDATLDRLHRRRSRWPRHGANPSIAGQMPGLGAWHAPAPSRSGPIESAQATSS